MARPRVRRKTVDRAWRVFASLATLVIVVSTSGETAQPIPVTEPGLSFFAAPAQPGAKPKRLDTARTTILSQRIRVDLHAVTIPDALAAIAQQSGLRFTYDRALLPAGARVTLSSDAVTVASALSHVLRGVNADVDLAADGLASLVARHPRKGGTITGRVSDSKTEQGIANATLLLEGVARGATTNDSGAYRISDVPPGSYTLAARFLGYTESRVAVTVVAEQQVTVNVALVQSANQLDQVVVAGTVVPTEVKAVPTPVSVITASDIELQRPQTVVQLFRQAVPSAVAWDFASAPEQTTFSVRGASSLELGSGSMKVYIDGIQTADQTFSAVDPQSIDRIEIIRGPEAATIYGSDAISGVILVTTKHGSVGSARPEIDLQAAAGVVQGPYSHQGGGDAARQDYSASLAGGTTGASYHVGGGYSSTGNWVPQGASSVPSADGAVHLTQGPLTLDLSGRDFAQDVGQPFPPSLAKTGFPSYLKPANQFGTYQDQTLGVSIAYLPVNWWRSTLTAGVDRNVQDFHSIGPALTTPADTFLTIENEDKSKVSVAYNSSISFALPHAVTASITGGVDHYEVEDALFFTGGATNTTGSIQTDPAQPVNASRTPVTNTGVFLQAQVGLGDQLFLTSGVRVEHNSGFSSDIGTPVSPRFGISYAPSFGETTLKVRASYGEALRPPLAGEIEEIATPGFLQIANTHLAPERQSGWDTGIDAVFGAHGSIGITFFDQIARDLIESVTVNADTNPQVSQYQNIGRVHNEGIEVEGAIRIPIGRLSAQGAITTSRVDALDPLYGGDLRVGDQLLAVPKYTGGISLAMSPTRKTTATVGVTYVGSWTNYDEFAELSCFGGTGPCAATTRGYISSYPGFVKVNVNVTQQLNSVAAVFISVKNLTDNENYEFYDAAPIQGRVTVAGVRIHY
jgi:outer membrane receptor protein involved in Fe transport